jgi:hypothetical protein
MGAFGSQRLSFGTSLARSFKSPMGSPQAGIARVSTDANPVHALGMLVLEVDVDVDVDVWMYDVVV